MGDLGGCLHPAPIRFIHASVCPLPPSSTVSNPPTLWRAGGRAGGCERGVCAALCRGRGRRPRGDARGCCGCSADGSSLSGWDGRGAGGPWRAEPGVRASRLLSVPRNLPFTPLFLLGAVLTPAPGFQTPLPPSSDSPDLPLPPALGID